MKRAFIFCFLLMSLSQLFAQNQTDSIEVRKKMGVVFVQSGTYLSPKALLEVFKSNEEAYKEMKIAKSKGDMAIVFGGAGGFLVGWTLGTAAGGGKPNWAVAGVGAGLIMVSIPFSNSYAKHAKNAVRIYNSGLKKLGLNRVETRFGLTYNGLALRVTF